MNRREFLSTVAIAPALAAVRTNVQQSRRRVVIVGAGLAGLSAGHELEAAGYDVTILEAQARPGGRVYTLRAPFADGLYAEAGAARIQDTHAFTLRFVKQFGLTLDSFFPASGQRVMLVSGKRIVGGFTLDTLPLQFSADERIRGYGGSLNHYLFRHLTALGDVSLPSWPAQDFSHFEMPLDEFCRRQGASAGMLTMIAFGHDLTGMSTLQFLRDAALGMSTKQWFKIRGGNDLLPRAFAKVLASRIRYGAPVIAIEQHDSSVRVIYRRDNEPMTLEADYVVCTLPTPVLQRVRITPALSSAKQLAIRQVGSLAMARVHLQTRTRFWLARDESGWGGTDDPMDVWDYTRDQPGERGILGAYLSGRMATRVAALDDRGRGSFVLDRMEQLHPGTREHFEVAASHSWTSDPWALGAGVAFDAGQLTRHYHDLRRPEGRIYFAGEHTSPWAGWMNGAIESGVRVAAEIRTAN